jgi:hypothetical protein
MASFVHKVYLQYNILETKYIAIYFSKLFLFCIFVLYQFLYNPLPYYVLADLNSSKMVNDDLIYMPVKGYENLYEVTQNGNIQSVGRTYLDTKGRKRTIKGKQYSSRIDRAGYPTVKLHKGKAQSTCYIHRILAEAFIPNPLGKPMVNHIDGNKLNNKLDNLEWVTNSENMKHAFKMGLCKVPVNGKKVIDTCTQKEYESIIKAAIAFDLPYQKCLDMLHGKVKNDSCLKIAS